MLSPMSSGGDDTIDALRDDLTDQGMLAVLLVGACDGGSIDEK
jgi:hypothetical protein